MQVGPEETTTTVSMSSGATDGCRGPLREMWDGAGDGAISGRFERDSGRQVLHSQGWGFRSEQAAQRHVELATLDGTARTCTAEALASVLEQNVTGSTPATADIETSERGGWDEVRFIFEYDGGPYRRAEVAIHTRLAGSHVVQVVSTSVDDGTGGTSGDMPDLGVMAERVDRVLATR